MSGENGTNPGSAFVVDASIAVKWFLKDEEFADEALAVLAEHVADHVVRPHEAP